MQSDDESDDDAFQGSREGGRNFVPVKNSLLFDDTGKYWLVYFVTWVGKLYYVTCCQQKSQLTFLLMNKKFFSSCQMLIFDSLRGFKTSLKTYLFRQGYNQPVSLSASDTLISLELWRFTNYITYLLNLVNSTAYLAWGCTAYIIQK